MREPLPLLGAYRGLQHFTQQVSFYGPGERLVLDSPTVMKALDIAFPSSSYKRPSLHGTEIDRLMFPFVTLVVPRGETTQELLNAVTPDAILRESDYPEQTKALKQSIGEAA